MIDTLRICGDKTRYNFNADFSRFIGYRKKDGTEKIVELLVEKNEYYQVFVNPGAGKVTVQLNPHKILFGLNIFNYEENPVWLHQLVRHCANYFFGNSDCYVSRLDIGGVVTYKNQTEAIKVLERFRGTRVPGGSLKKYRHQNYADSVFYWSRHWSIKIYNKGVEMGCTPDMTEAQLEKAGTTNEKILADRSPAGFDLLATLRYEKTYRFRELERIGSLPYQKAHPQHKAVTDMPVKPNWGVHIDDLRMDLIMYDFKNIFEKWDFAASESLHPGELKGVHTLLYALDKLGKLSELESLKAVSTSTMGRYRKKKRENPEFEPFVKFVNNLDTKSLNNKRRAHTFGLSGFLLGNIPK